MKFALLIAVAPVVGVFGVSPDFKPPHQTDDRDYPYVGPPIHSKPPVYSTYTPITNLEHHHPAPTWHPGHEWAPRVVLNESDVLIVCDADTTTTHGLIQQHKFTEGTNYLRHGSKRCGASAGDCSRVSCSWRAAIWLCYDKDTYLPDMDCHEIADAYDQIRLACGIKKDRNQVKGFEPGVLQGYYWNSTGWVVNAGWNIC